MIMVMVALDGGWRGVFGKEEGRVRRGG